MKVSEVIRRLQEFDQDAQVVVPGNMEFGFDDVTSFAEMTLTDVFGRASARGPYQTVGYAKKYEKRMWCEPFNAVFIGCCDPWIVEDRQG